MPKSSEALTLQYSIDLKLCYWEIKVFPQNFPSALVAFLKQQPVPMRHFYSRRRGPDMWPAPPGLGEAQIEDFAKKSLSLRFLGTHQHNLLDRIHYYFHFQIH